MSLINQMLKDLAQRAKPVSSPDVFISGLVATTYSDAKKNKFYYSLIISSLFLSLLFIFAIVKFYLLPRLHQSPIASIQIHPIAKPKPMLTETSIPVVHARPAGLTGITLQAEKETTSLRLFLSQNTLYRITGNGKNQVMLVLENTRLIANLPQIDTTNSAFKILRMTNQADGSLKIIFILNAGAELTRLEMTEADQHPELKIDFSYNNVVDPVLHNISLGDQGDVVEEHQMQSIKKLSYDTSMDTDYKHAMNFSDQGQNKEAITQLTNLLVKYPAFIPARKSLATLLLKQNNISKAQQVIEVGLQQQPLYLPYIQLKAQILVNKGNIKQALTLLQTTAPPLEENPEYHAFMAALYQRQNQPMLAEKLYERLLNLQPNNSMWWMGLGIARESLNQNSAALEAYQKANTDNLSTELKVYVENRIHTLL